MKTNRTEVLGIVLLSAAVLHAPLAAQVAPAWTQVATTGPSARQNSAMAYDSQHGRTVLFGGNNNTNPPYGLDDTWEWNGNTWTQVAITGPVARLSHAMAYDSQRGRIVLFGGWNSSGLLGGTWEWDGTSWAQVANTGPSARHSHAMAYDSQRGRTVLFGGYDGNLLNDTWEWNGSTWSQVATTGPVPRYHHRMAYDSQRGRTVLFGGWETNNTVHFDDTWEWDGTSWSQVATTGPSARQSHAMVYDSQCGRTVLFGGGSGFGTPSSFGDTWEWNGSTWTQVATTGPVARYSHAMAYDSQRGRTVLFGGRTDGTVTGINLGDTWERGIPFTPSSAIQFGTGCGNPALVLSPMANAPPIINTTAQVLLTNIPSSLAFVALGWSRTLIGTGPFVLPFPLGGYGLPGCFMLQSADVAAQPVSFTGSGTAIYSLPLPNWCGQIGMHLFLQGWANAPGANSANLIVSNGVDWRIGNS